MNHLENGIVHTSGIPILLEQGIFQADQTLQDEIAFFVIQVQIEFLLFHLSSLHYSLIICGMNKTRKGAILNDI